MIEYAYLMLILFQFLLYSDLLEESSLTALSNVTIVFPFHNKK